MASEVNYGSAYGWGFAALVATVVVRFWTWAMDHDDVVGVFDGENLEAPSGLEWQIRDLNGSVVGSARLVWN